MTKAVRISIIVMTNYQYCKVFHTSSITHGTYSMYSTYLLLKSSKQAAGNTLNSPSLTALACTPNLPTVQCLTMRLRYSALLLSVTRVLPPIGRKSTIHPVSLILSFKKDLGLFVLLLFAWRDCGDGVVRYSALAVKYRERSSTPEFSSIHTRFCHLITEIKMKI